MGKAFARLEKQVLGRVSPRNRRLRFPERIRMLEVFALELGSYLQKHVATNPEDASDAALVAAYEEFKVALEGTIG